jgi:hypothetical protein
MMKAHFHLSSTTGLKTGYYSLDPLQPFSKLLKDTEFYEYPTVEVWEQFSGIVIDKEGGVIEEAEQEFTRAKRRRIDIAAGKEAIRTLVGGYGSDGSEPTAEEEHGRSGLDVLEGYGENVSEYEESDTELDPAALQQGSRQRTSSLLDWDESSEESDL